MKKHPHEQSYAKIFTLAAAVSLGASILSADDIELKINGASPVAASGSAIVPGWSLESKIGSARIVAGEDRDEFAVELSAPAKSGGTMLVSDMHAVTGNALKIEASIKGSGSAEITLSEYDANKKALPPGYLTRAFAATQKWMTVKRSFEIDTAKVKYVRIKLSVPQGSTVAFCDVDAEFKNKNTGSAAVQVQAAPAVTVSAATLVDDKYYTLKDIDASGYAAEVTVGDDIEFELEENSSEKQLWRVVKYDPEFCRVKLEHDTDGVWPFRRDKTEIELKGIKRGVTDVVFGHPSGKTFSVRLTII